jgi:hypothetical protein
VFELSVGRRWEGDMRLGDEVGHYSTFECWKVKLKFGRRVEAGFKKEGLECDAVWSIRQF